MRRPMDVGISSVSDAGLEETEPVLAEAELADAPAACTSLARISPPGPEPCTREISTSSSFARRRALGEIFAVVGVLETGAAADAATGISTFVDVALAVGAVVPPASSAGTASPGATIHAMIWPTGMSWPADALMPAKRPSAW